MNAVAVFILRLILILLVYAFIGWIVYVIFYDLFGSMRTKTSTSIPSLFLYVELNGERLDKAITSQEVIIGRDPACDVFINNETISLRHCKLYYHHKHWWVEDLLSTNGSYLNEIRIETPVILTSGDSLQLGAVNISIEFNERSEANHE